MTPRHVLDGYRMLDLSQYLAGPAATNLMVQMGAEVIKVEIGPHGDPIRAFPYLNAETGRSAYFVQQNRGKKSLCLNPKTAEGLGILKELVKHCDVLIENFAPGVIDRLGLGWEVVRQIKPDLIMCSISAFGQTGPLAEFPGFDFIAQAYAGVTDLMGEADLPPCLPMLAFGDVGTGVHAVTAIGYALLERARTGRGQLLDISLLDTYYHHHEISVQGYSGSKGRIVPRRNGGHHYAVAPTGVFKSKDGYLVILALLHQWPVLCKVMGREDLIDDPRYKENDDRVAHIKEVTALIEGWLQAQDSDAAALAKLEAGRIPCAPILTVPQAMAHPHMIERQTVRTISDPWLGEFQIPGMPLRFSKYEVPTDLQAPLLGEHNEEVLTDRLGYSSAQIAKLVADKILFRKLPKTAAIAASA